VEDTDTTEEELRRLFGNEVTGNCIFMLKWICWLADNVIKRIVNETYDAETEMRPRHRSLETETRRDRDVGSDGIETRPRHSKNALRLY